MVLFCSGGSNYPTSPEVLLGERERVRANVMLSFDYVRRKLASQDKRVREWARRKRVGAK